ncbi:hypothetical protein [Flagellimonas sp. 2504JD1-5]|nr:hypothetical protein [uncultured Allomuricauda sp.]
MKRTILLIQFTILSIFSSFSQDTKFTPEVTFGNRAVSYQHLMDYSLSENWSVNNVTLFDTEYGNEDNNIFFVRNTLSYSLSQSFKTNIAFGVKNPGGFLTGTAQYSLNTPSFKATYVVGSTYQNGFTLEQSLSFQYTRPINEGTEFFTSLFTVFNTDLKYLDRGIQQIRVGIKKAGFQAGLAFNLDQFKKAEKTLENFGFALKYNY